MGQEISQLWQGATSFGGDLLKGDFGGAAGQIGSIPGAIGKDIAGPNGLFTNPAGNITGPGQGVTFAQGNPGAPVPSTGGGAAPAPVDLSKLNGGAPVDVQAPQLAGGVTPTADGSYGSIGGSASPEFMSQMTSTNPTGAPAMGGIGQGADAVQAGAYQPGDFYSNLTKSNPSSDLMAALGGESLKTTPDMLQAALAQITGGGPQAAAAGAAGGAGGAAKGDYLHQLLGMATDPKNLPKELMGALTGVNMLNASQAGAAEHKMIEAQLATAQRQQAGAQNRIDSAQAGYLPTELQAGIDLAENKAEAAIRSQYGAAGMSGSSAETADIAAARTQAATQRFQEAQKLADQSINLLSGYNSEVSGYMKTLMDQQMQQDQMFQSALGDFFTEMGMQRPATPAHTTQ